MTITTQFDDTNEGWHDTDAEQLANQGQYAVLTGCAVTYDAADLTVDVAAGIIVHNGIAVAVAGGVNAVTLVADASNKRWAYITADSTGTVVLISGDAAVSSAVEPSKPELGDRVLLAMVKVEALQTVANNIAVKLDKRLIYTGLMNIAKTADETVNNSNTLQNDDVFSFPVRANTSYLVEMVLTVISGATPDFKYAWSLPAGAAAYASGATTASPVAGTGANQAVFFYGMIRTAGTAGTAQFQWAQDTADASDTKVLASSLLRYRPCV